MEVENLIKSNYAFCDFNKALSIYLYKYNDFPSYYNSEIHRQEYVMNTSEVISFIKDKFPIEKHIKNLKHNPYYVISKHCHFDILIGENVVIEMDDETDVLSFYFDENCYLPEYFEEICDYIYNNKDIFYIKRETKNKIGFITKCGSELIIHSHDSHKAKQEIDINKNYNDEFIDIDKKIKKTIENEDNGLILLHSEPGCGKTYYLRHLINYFEDKEFVFVPSSMTNILSSPEFMTFALENLKNKVLIVEDGEKTIQDRSKNSDSNNSAISNLLNLTDGLISDALNLQVICTFNCEINDIDTALRRKGRLLVEYQIQKLAIDKSNNLLSELGKNKTTNKPMSLAEIYNELPNTFNIKEKDSKIGF